MKRTQSFLFALVLTIAVLTGCSRPYASLEDYESKRVAELGADSNAKTEIEIGGAKYRLWTLSSGQGWLDKISEADGAVRVEEARVFDTPDDAVAWSEVEKVKGTPPVLTWEDYRDTRKEELSATSGSWVGNTDSGNLYAWLLPDGTYIVDSVTLDAQGGAKFNAEESRPFPDKASVDAIAQPRAALLDYLTKRSQELSATVDWGANYRNWQVYAFKSESGYTLDVVRPDPDPLGGMIVRKTQTLASLNDVAAWVTSEQTNKNLWGTANQYSLGGWSLILFLLLIITFVLYNIWAAKKGKPKTIRRIAGLDQIDEAVGRATEIARPVLMVPGLGQLNGITVQALTVFAYVIRTAARFGTPIRLLNADASVYAVAQEIARDVYMSEGVPEQYDPTSVQFVSDRQFAFAAGVAGTIQRERVAATFFMGDFFAESMIFAENANMVGAIQVAATTQFTQTPFFIAACDYVLLGDEFYAASAYLGRQPVLIGSLIGVDWAKMLIMAAVIVAAGTHSVQMTRPVEPSTINPEAAAQWQQTGQKYLDWRRNEIFFKRLTKTNRN